MVRKIALMTIFSISHMGCDDDFKQGSCEEGFYQQNDGNGGYFCAPIVANGEILDNTVPDADILNQTDQEIGYSDETQ